VRRYQPPVPLLRRGRKCPRFVEVRPKRPRTVRPWPEVSCCRNAVSDPIRRRSRSSSESCCCRTDPATIEPTCCGLASSLCGGRVSWGQHWLGLPATNLS
jgi:hypothetical protein